jgi:hypothetical protein
VKAPAISARPTAALASNDFNMLPLWCCLRLLKCPSQRG